MSGLTRTTLIECPRSQSDEGMANNNQNPSRWTNQTGDGIHLKPGDKISVHSSYVSEIGAEAGQIQIKGQELNASVEIETTDTTNSLYVDKLPSKFTLVEKENTKKTITIRDDTLNLVVSPYKTANGEYYAHLPRRWIGDGNAMFWTTYQSRDNATISGDIGQTQNAPYPLNRCKADLNTKYWFGRSGAAHIRHRIDGINDGARYTIFTRKHTFYGTPANLDYTVEGSADVASNIITLHHGATTADLIVGMELITQSPEVVFGIGEVINSIISETEIEMSGNASSNTNTHNLFTFRFPVADSDEFLPPTTNNSSFTPDECESFRDPALWGDYIQVKNLVSVKANPGYNSPTDLADQLTQELNERTDFQKYDYPTESAAKDFIRREAFTFKTETPAYKVYNCATASYYSKVGYNQWSITGGSWNVPEAYQYLSSYQNIGIKRPELYLTGLKVNGSLKGEGDYTGGFTGDRNGLNTGTEIPMGIGESVFVSGVKWTKENILRFKDFFDAQSSYPELFDYTQNDTQVNIDETRFIHMNLYDSANGSGFIPALADAVRFWNFGANVRSPKVPEFGYDLYDASVSASQTSYPLFIDYNPANENVSENDVGYTDRGFNYFYDGLEPNYNDLAYGFARKIRVQTTESTVEYYIGFQFTKTGNKIPDHFFHTNASATTPEPTQVLGAGGRTFGYDWHFTSYGTAAMILYNGNSNVLGSSFASNLDSTLYRKTYRFAQATGEPATSLDPYQFGMYLGAETPVISYNEEQQRFQLSNLHTTEKIGNIFDAGISRNAPQQKTPDNPAADDPCYKINKRLVKWNYCPEMTPYDDNFNGSGTVNAETAYISHNVGIEPWSIMDAQSGLFIEDWVVPENLWDESLIGVMGYRYDQFHNESKVSSRQTRLKAHGANADLHNINIITTNANVSEGDIGAYQMNSVAAKMPTPVLPVATTPTGENFTPQGRYITPAVVVSPVNSVNITAQRIPSKTLRPYYTIRSDIIAEPNQVLGGYTSGITMPIVAITNKANPYGDFLNGFQGQITFTNTIDRVLTRIRCSIHEPDGSAARVDLNSAVIFRIDQEVNAKLNLVGDLLQSKDKQDQLIAQEVEEPLLEYQDLKYDPKELFE